MKRTLFTVFILLFFLTIKINAQLDSVTLSPQYDVASLALGAGLDYGGFGLNGLFYPHKNIGLFASAGYALVDLGYNVGVKTRVIPNSMRFAPYITAMYGYNAVVAVDRHSQYNKIFYGPTFGIGFDFKSRPYKSGYWSFALLLPIRSSDVNKYIEDLKTNHGVWFDNNLLPFGISIGYRFIIN